MLGRVWDRVLGMIVHVFCDVKRGALTPALTLTLSQDGRGGKKGNHKGCPYDGLAGGNFRGISRAGLSSAHRGMKLGIGSSVVDFRKATSGDGFPPSRE